MREAGQVVAQALAEAGGLVDPAGVRTRQLDAAIEATFAASRRRAALQGSAWQGSVPGGQLHLGQRGGRPRHSGRSDPARPATWSASTRAAAWPAGVPTRPGRFPSVRSTSFGTADCSKPVRACSSWRSPNAAGTNGGPRWPPGWRKRSARPVLARSRISWGTASAVKCTRIPKFPTTSADRCARPISTSKPGLVLAIEPMVNAGGKATETSSQDHWTVRHLRRQPSVHFEHTVALTAEGPLVLTAPSGIEVVESRRADSSIERCGFFSKFVAGFTCGRLCELHIISRFLREPGRGPLGVSAETRSIRPIGRGQTQADWRRKTTSIQRLARYWRFAQPRTALS